MFKCIIVFEFSISIKNEKKEHNLEIWKIIIIEASPEVIFEAITKSDELTQWFPDQAILEAKIGGKVKFVHIKEILPEWKLDRDCVMEGTVVELVPNKKISYTWKYNDIPEFPETTVIWELEEVEPNRTRVQLTHLGFTGEEKGLTSFESHNEDWTEMLNKLAKYCR